MYENSAKQASEHMVQLIKKEASSVMLDKASSVVLDNVEANCKKYHLKSNIKSMISTGMLNTQYLCLDLTIAITYVLSTPYV